MVRFFVPIRDDRRLMDDAIPIDGTKEIFVRDLLECYSQACRNDKMPGYRKFLSNYTNIPRTAKLSRDDITTDEWSFDVSGLRDQTKINDNQTVASLYQDGGKAENKVLPYATLKLVVGSEIEFRPPPQYRKQKFMRHLKFRVVAADAEANVVDADRCSAFVRGRTRNDTIHAFRRQCDLHQLLKEAEEEEVEFNSDVVAVEDEEAVVEEVEEAEVVVVADADTDADDGVKEAEEVEEEQLVRFP